MDLLDWVNWCPDIQAILKDCQKKLSSRERLTSQRPFTPYQHHTGALVTTPDTWTALQQRPQWPPLATMFTTTTDTMRPWRITIVPSTMLPPPQADIAMITTVEWRRLGPILFRQRLPLIPRLNISVAWWVPVLDHPVCSSRLQVSHVCNPVHSGLNYPFWSHEPLGNYFTKLIMRHKWAK